MKRIFNIYRKLLTALAVLCFTSSCTDYLTIIPPDKITEEFYWQTKDDVNGILAKAYLNLLGTDAMQKAIIWGELRSDNLNLSIQKNEPDLEYIVEANLLEENSYCSWAIYYEAIQTANLVIDRAPQVVDRDPDFTEGDLQVVLGEMYALRALAHFYLVRAFRDIPMATELVADDNEMPEYSQVHPLEALNSIMADLEKAQDMVMKSGNFSSEVENLGRITENAVLAIKADVNLWRAAFAQYYEDDTKLVKAGDIQNYYDACVEDCQKVIDNMDLLFMESSEGEKNFGLYPYNLIQNEGDDKDKKAHLSTVYNAIFGNKNSRESILELQVEGDNITNKSALAVCYMYGAQEENPKLVVPKNFYKKYESDDLRLYSFIDYDPNGSSSADVETRVTKYVAQGSPAYSSANMRKSKDDFGANWIVYRKTDVLLMMAEAMVLRPSNAKNDFQDAFKIVQAINARSRINVDTTQHKKPYKFKDYPTRETLHELVLKERQLELCFEGKRWFDLVRKALREKTTNNIKFVADKLDSNSGVVKSKMSTIDGLFMPIHENELRYNKKLKQNPVYIKDDSSTELN